MHRISQNIAILFVLSALLLVPSIALGAVTLTYSGETGESGSGIDSYSGSDYSDSLWDYVYDLSATSTDGPFYWGIATFGEVDDIYSPAFEPGVGLWLGGWDSNIGASEYNGAFAGTNLEGECGVVWSWYQTQEGATPHTGTFHFRSEHAPDQYNWVADGNGTAYDGAGLEWSASPEPASMALYGLSLLAVGFWRRRKKTG